MTARACRLVWSSALLSDSGFARRRWSSSFFRFFTPTLSSSGFCSSRSTSIRIRNGGSRLRATLASSVSEEAGDNIDLATTIYEQVAGDADYPVSMLAEEEAHGMVKESHLCGSKNAVEELLGNAEKVRGLMRMERKPDLSKADEPVDMSCSQLVEDAAGKRWFPYLDAFRTGDTTLTCAEILESIEPRLLYARKERLKNVVKNRSYSVCLVVEGLTDFGNVSAAFRSADALGFQSVHVISRDSSKRYRENRNVSMGSEKWLDLELWNSTQDCFKVLKSRGYRIATACVGTDVVSIHDIDWTIPTAIVVGNEHSGISEEAGQLADLHCCIPMMGMVDSFNVSVAAGIIMHHAVRDRSARLGFHGDLTPEESKILLAEFYLRHRKDSVSIAHEFAKRKLVQQMAKL
ncbi:uncharacterized protein LOC116257481 [Nymphaea colorata]|nr:uncharacterized protein LOC116257481 [Nymphaea colorata]